MDLGRLESSNSKDSFSYAPRASFFRRYPLLVLVFAAVGLLSLFAFLSVLPSSSSAENVLVSSDLASHLDGADDPNRTVFRFAIVTDMDEASKVVAEKAKNSYWHSWMRQGTLTRNVHTGRYSLLWDNIQDKVELVSKLNEGGRGMELSWLQRYHGKLYSADDRSGIVYEIANKQAYPRFALADGNGFETKGFKSEWSAVKDDMLYISSFGKEWSSDAGEYVNSNPMWIKVIDRFGGVTHVDWSNNWLALRAKAGYNAPGYLLHESGAWNEELKRWFFLPRRASHSKYNPDMDEQRGTNLLLSADETFTDIQVRHVDFEVLVDNQPKGFSEIKFIPGRARELVALSTVEHGEQTKSYITVMDIDGKTLMEDSFIEDNKYEGLEFIG